MPYTTAWDDTKPLGSRWAKEIDDIIRDLKKDIHERMDDIVADWTADPVVPLGGGGGGTVSLGGKASLYWDSNPIGAKETSKVSIAGFLCITMEAVTTNQGFVFIRMSEFGDGWVLADILNNQVGDSITFYPFHLINCIDSGTGLNYVARIAQWNHSTEQIGIQIVKKTSEFDVLSTRPVTLHIMLPVTTMK